MCDLYSKKLVKNFKHASTTERGNTIECIGNSPLFLLHFTYHSNEPTTVNPKEVNVNKMVADLIFELFLCSKAHMGLLLGDYKQYGVGVTFKELGVTYVVVRGY
jgi:hypothetical protein